MMLCRYVVFTRTKMRDILTAEYAESSASSAVRMLLLGCSEMHLFSAPVILSLCLPVTRAKFRLQLTTDSQTFMKKLVLICAACVALSHRAVAQDVTRWQQEAQRVTIIRDDWGIPHIYGTSDADAVFGLIYAQAEDDFNRVDTHFINAMGRLAEAEGESAIYRDLRMTVFSEQDRLET